MEDGSKELIVALVEVDHPHLQIVLVVVSGEGGLTSDVGRTAVFRAGDGNVGGLTGVVAAVVVVERGDRRQEMGIESVKPGEKDAGIGFVLSISQSDAG